MEVHRSDYSLLSFYFLFTISLQGGLWSSREERRSEARSKGNQTDPR